MAGDPSHAATGADLARTARGRKGRSVHPASRDLVRWLRLEALPLWASKGWDSKRGGFHERLFFDGTADDLVLRRVRVQWRQIYVYAHAAMLGWHEGLKLAFKGLELLLQRAWAPDGAPGFVHILAPDGSVAEARRDTYDHAFAILALSYLARASGDAQVRALLDLVLHFVTGELSAPDGTLREGVPHALPRRQNPHMHMLEAMLAASDLLQHPETPALAARYRRLLETRFLNRGTGLLLEDFNEDWTPLREGDACRVEPGHMAEWVWLIRRYERLFAQKASPMGTHLLGAALRAAEPSKGFLLDEIDSAMKVRKASRRLWPQTELAKAWIAQSETGADRADDSAGAVIEALMASYLSGPFPGGWYDVFDAAGKAATDTVPASSLYHIFVLAAEADRVLGS